MAMNDISMLVVSEQDSYLFKKDNDKVKLDSSNSVGFFDQLALANQASETQEAQVKALNKQSLVEQADLKDQSSEEQPLSGEDMLAQINAAQVIDTSVKSNFNATAEKLDMKSIKIEGTPEDRLAPIVIDPQADKAVTDESAINENPANKNAAYVTDISAKNSFNETAEKLDMEGMKINGKPEDKLAPIVINLPSDEIVDDAAILQPLNTVGAESASKATAETVQVQLGTKPITMAATAGQYEAVSNKLAAAKPLDKPTDTTMTKSSLDASVLALLSKDDTAIKSDKLLTNLTPIQQGELAIKLDAMSKPINQDNLADIKQLLSKFVTQNEKPQSPQQFINAQISVLTTPEKQALLSQLREYIKNEPLPAKELASLKGVISDLEIAINAGALLNDKGKSLFNNSTLTAEVTPKAQPNTEPGSVKSDLKLDNSKVIADGPQELAKQLGVLQKDSLRATNAEQMPPRAAQVFSQIINVFDKPSLNTLAKYETLGYEQAVIEAQSLQAGQLQSTAHVKQVSVDPVTLQALNIIKSDAAKMLQERVSSMLSINNKEAEIRLDPPEMGSMHIRIRSDAEQAQINFVVQNQQAKEALEQSLPRLREMLMQQGLDLGESSISYGDPSKEQGQQEGNSQEKMVNEQSTDETKSDQPDKQNHGSEQQTSSSIDYYA